MTRILIVDDEEEVVDVLKDLLEMNHYVVDTSLSGEEALEKARSDPPSLIISDINMPEMSGFGLCAELRDTPETSNIPVILISGHYGSEGDALIAQKVGAAYFLGKPINFDLLLSKIVDLLGGV